MKIFSRLFLLSVLALAVQSPAALESAKFDPNNQLPRFPPPLQMAGVSRGVLVAAVSVSADGAITDTLVLGYSNEWLVRPTLDAIKTWKVTPARLDGQTVPVRVVLSFDFTLEGAVLTTNIVEHYLYGRFDLDNGTTAYRVHRASELDKRPELINPVKPKYALDAEKQGVRGTVEVEFYIDETGAVRMPALKDVTHPYLAEMAVAAVREWKFSPPTHHGKPVMVAASQEFSFGEAK